MEVGFWLCCCDYGRNIVGECVNDANGGSGGGGGILAEARGWLDGDGPSQNGRISRKGAEIAKVTQRFFDGGVWWCFGRLFRRGWTVADCTDLSQRRKDRQGYAKVLMEVLRCFWRVLRLEGTTPDGRISRKGLKCRQGYANVVDEVVGGFLRGKRGFVRIWGPVKYCCSRCNVLAHMRGI